MNPQVRLDMALIPNVYAKSSLHAREARQKSQTALCSHLFIDLARTFKPSAPITFKMVSKAGLYSLESALYRLFQ